MKNRLVCLMLMAVMLLWGSAPAAAVAEIQWWHAMGGPLGEKVEAICKDFNTLQNEYKVTPVYKGNYTECMTNTIAAFRAKQHPHIV